MQGSRRYHYSVKFKYECCSFASYISSPFSVILARSFKWIPYAASPLSPTRASQLQTSPHTRRRALLNTSSRLPHSDASSVHRRLPHRLRTASTRRRLPCHQFASIARGRLRSSDVAPSHSSHNTTSKESFVLVSLTRT
jgi:hypothetical protein